MVILLIIFDLHPWRGMVCNMLVRKMCEKSEIVPIQKRWILVQGEAIAILKPEAYVVYMLRTSKS